MPLGGETVDVADIDGLDHDGTADSSVGTAAANFTSPSATVRTALKGHLVSFGLSITSTNAITSTSGNTTNTTIFTLDAAYRPSEQRRVAIVVDGSAIAGGFIQTNGTVQVAVASHNIAAGAVLSLSDTWLMP